MGILDVPTPVSSTIGLSFTQVSGPGFFVNSTEQQNITDTNIDIIDNVLLSFLQRNFFGGFVFGNVSIITDAAGPRSGTFNEDFVTNISFSIFNQGTWDFASSVGASQGAFGGAPNDALRLVIGQGLPTPVPLPSTGFLLIAGLAAVGAARRYGRSRQN
ncbi:MAG: PEP-CTERM sorting domain-containing protein [Pseudomonadota bacterium]